MHIRYNQEIPRIKCVVRVEWLEKGAGFFTTVSLKTVLIAKNAKHLFISDFVCVFRQIRSEYCKWYLICTEYLWFASSIDLLFVCLLSKDPE